MPERVFLITWNCISCGTSHSFRRALGEFDDWPNKFEDMECGNPDCGQVQDVRFTHCAVEPLQGMT